MKQKVYSELAIRCQKRGIVKDDFFTASDLATALNVSRNSVSQYLNEFVKEGKIIKINTRPVYFYSKEEVELFFENHSDICEFCSFDDFFHIYNSKQYNFEKLIGYDNSLKNVVEQCKAAITYPGNGLPILIHGPTGTGKSMIANLMYEFAVDQKLIQPDKKFVAVNCSEYANNPELLTANLFGHVKGAYTGADEDNEGLIASADGGVLFLDEVHCLRAECQEKLFFFMDKGIYHAVGDNENWNKSNCRIVFATTENPQDVLLKTLLRRIPIMVKIPSLSERPLIEKKGLIYSIFNQEALHLNKKMFISNVVYQTLMDFEFIGNVGAMKNAIKATCATAFLNVQNGENEKIEIHVYDLPDYILASFPTMQLKSTQDMNHTMIPLDKLDGPITFSTPLLHLYDKILVKHEDFFKSNQSFTIFVDEVHENIQNFMDYIMYKNRYQKNTNNDFMLKMLDKIFSIVINKYSIAVSNSEIQIYSTILSEYTKYIVDAKVWISSRREKVDHLITNLIDNLPREYNIAKEIVENAAINLDLELDDVMLAILTLSLVTSEKSHTSGRVGVILCHGYSTASSIANATNRMLGEYVFDGLDMELDVNVDKIVSQLDQYLKHKAKVDDLILLVDMGSLEEIYKKIKPIANCNIGLMNNVTTKLALEVGNGISLNQSIDKILKNVSDTFELSTHYVEGRAKKDVILAVCATGFGAAKKISELLIESLPKKVPVEIIPYEYQSLVENGQKDNVFSRYNVPLIVGTLDPKVKDYTFIPVEDLVMKDGIEELEKVVEEYLSENEVVQFRQNITKNFTLSNIVNHLTILNAEKVIDDVEEIVEELEHGLEIELDVARKAGLYVHLSCLIERLMLRNEVTNMEFLEDALSENKDFIEKARDAFSGAEMRYSVEVPDAELVLLMNYFKKA